MDDRPSTSTQDGGDAISDTHPELSSDEWFSMLRDRAAQTRHVYNLSPPSSPETLTQHKVRNPSVRRSRRTPNVLRKTKRIPRRRKHTRKSGKTTLLNTSAVHQSEQHTEKVVQNTEQPAEPVNRRQGRRSSQGEKMLHEPEQQAEQTSEQPAEQPQEQPAEAQQERPTTVQKTTHDSGSKGTMRDLSNSEKPYIISKTYTRKVKIMHATEEVYEVQFHRQYLGRKLIDMKIMMYDMFDEVLKRVSAGRQPQDRGRVYIHQPDFHKPVVVHLRPLPLITPSVILDRLSHVLQSMENLKMDGSFKIKVGIMNMPVIEDNV